MRRYLLILLFFSFTLSTNAQVITTFAGDGIPGDTGDGFPATAASLNQPFACAFDSHGNFYFTEVEGVRVRMVNSAGIISTFAGGSSALGDGGPATAAQFSDPTGIAIDASDNVYVADLTGYRIRKIDAITGIITTIAGNGSPGYGGDNGLATAAIIDANNVCIDGLGNIYILDGGNYRIRKINTSGIITTVVGSGIPGYYGDGGAATAAQIEDMSGLCADALGNIYFTQSDYNHIRKVNVSSGIITSIAGNGGPSGDSGDGGPATAAGIYPYDIAFDRFGNLYVSCETANDIRKVDVYGIIHAVAGNGTGAYGGDGGQATAAELNIPVGVALDSCGNLFIVDKNNNRIRKVAINPSCINLSASNIKITEPVSIYPNPAYDILNIDNLKTQASYSLQSIVGATMQKGTLKAGSNSISLQAMACGMYMLEITDEEGKRTVKKIIKQ